MARFKIMSKDGKTVRYEGKPKYIGTYLQPSYLSFSEVNSPSIIEWEVGDYVDYPHTGMRYSLYSIPQPSKKASKGSHGEAFTYSGLEFYAATKELDIALFKDLVSSDNNIHFSTNPDVVTFEDVAGIARRIQSCMDFFYPDRWIIRIADFDATEDAEIIEKITTAKDFALSGGTCLDALSKIYELWEDIGWFHTYENDKDVITIGYTNKRVSANTTDAYVFGKGNGLTAIKKIQSNIDSFATRLYIYGSERNIPSRYYNSKDILNAESLDIRNLMIPIDHWNTTDGVPDARKAYLENAEAVAKHGVIPKTHYFDSEDANADIYPTIERMTIGEIRSVMQSGDTYYPSEEYSDTDRADTILGAENPADDGVLNKDGKQHDFTSQVDLDGFYTDITIPENSYDDIITNLTLANFACNMSGAIRLSSTPSMNFVILGANLESVKVTFEYIAKFSTKFAASKTIVSNTTKINDTNWLVPIPSVKFDFNTAEYESFNVYLTAKIEISPISGVERSVTVIPPTKDFSIYLDNINPTTFDLTLRQIGFSVEDMASLGEGKSISMKSGLCEGRKFEIVSCSYNNSNDTWTVTCKRQKDNTLGMLFPNSIYPISTDDKFVLLDIAMPETYIKVAENRLLAEGQKLLAKVSAIQNEYEPSVDAKVMYESGRILREGMFMEITDEDVVDNASDYILIDTLNIIEGESAIPTYRITLRKEAEIRYKGTPSATSSDNTNPVDDDNDEQVSVDLTGYAKEAYVNDKVKDVADYLASMWSFDEAGYLVTNKQVVIKNNLIVAGDTSSTKQGTDQGTSGTLIGIKVGTTTYGDEYTENGILNLSDAFDPYYTKDEVDSKIAGVDVSEQLKDYAKLTDVDSKIAAIDLSPYAKSADVASTYATKDNLATLQTEVDNIEAVLGMDEEAEGVINTWNEVKAFLDGYSSSDDLAAILSAMNADIAKRALQTDLEALSLTVEDNTGNIKKNYDAIALLGTNKADKATTLAGYGITDAYTKDEVTAELAKYVKLEGSQTIKGDITIEGNLIVKGDTSSTKAGTDAGVAGTLLGITFNGVKYDEPVNGILTIPNTYYTTEQVDDLIAGVDVSSQLAGYQPLITANSKLDYSLIANTPTIPTNTNQLTNGAGYITSITLTGDDYISVNGYKLSLVLDAQGGLTDTGQGLGVNNLRNSLKFGSKSFDGSSAVELTASDLGALTSHQSLDGYVNAIATSGSGNAVTAVSKSGKTITYTFGSTFLTGITSAMVTNALGYTPLSTAGGTMTGGLTLLGSGTTYLGFAGTNGTEYGALGISSAHEPKFWNGSGAYTLYHTGNFNPADYLPLSGGTINGTTFRPLVVDATYNDITEIGIANKGTIYSGFGYNGGYTFMGREDGGGYPKIAIRHSDGAPIYSPNNLSTTYPLIHSGNIGDYALKTDGSNEMKGRIKMGGYAIQWNVGDYGLVLSPENIFGTGKPELAFHDNTNWHQIAFTDSNVASATKLQTARTIWGQSFDGTGNVSGYFDLGYSVIRGGGTENAFEIAQGSLTVGYSFRATGCTTTIYGDTIRVAKNGAFTMWINPSGNVTIGGSDLAGTSAYAKLCIDGVLAMMKGSSRRAVLGFSEGDLYLGFESINTYNTYVSGNNVLLSPINNVGIGTTSPAYKLDVNGTARINDTLRVGVSDSSYYELFSNWGLVYHYTGTGGWNRGISFEANNSVFAAFGAYSGVGAYIGTGYTDRWFDINSSVANFHKPVTMSSTLSIADAINSTHVSGLDITACSGVAAARVFLTKGSFRPWIVDNELVDLGVSGARWKGLYCKTGNFSGALTAGDTTISGNLIVSGDTSTGSDIRFKDKLKDKTIKIEHIAKAPLFTFKWNDREDDATHLGSSAQYWENITPWLVSGEDFKSLNYAGLGVAMGISLAKKAMNHEERIKVLEKENKALKEEIRRMRYGS